MELVPKKLHQTKACNRSTAAQDSNSPEVKYYDQIKNKTEKPISAMDPLTRSQRIWIHLAFLCVIVLLSQLTLTAASSESDQDGAAGNSSKVVNGTDDNSDKSTANTGAVVAAVVIAVIVCIAVVIIVYMVKRKRQSRMMDKEKKMQIQMSSARNAGVYQDLTVSVPADDKPASPEHERLQSAEEA